MLITTTTSIIVLAHSAHDQCSVVDWEEAVNGFGDVSLVFFFKAHLVDVVVLDSTAI